jgi:uncharacterized protein
METRAQPSVDIVVPAGEYHAVLVARGQTLRIIDVEGQQCADFAAFNLNHAHEKLSCVFTKSTNGVWKIGKGHTLISDLWNPMFVITEDTVGVHYFTGGFCSEESNHARFGVRGTRNCRDNLAMAIAPFGLEKFEVWPDCSPTFFMNVDYLPDGRQVLGEPLSKPGDYVELRVEMDCLFALSACPQDKNACNGFRPTPLRLIVK